MTYSIKFKDGKSLITGLTFDQVLEYKINNIENKNNFDIVEQVDTKKVSKKQDEEKEIFLSTLTDIQKSDIKSGRRKLKYSEENKFWYLQLVSDDEIHVTHSIVKSNRNSEIKKTILDSIKTFKEYIWEDILYSDVTEEEFNDYFSRLTFLIRDEKSKRHQA